MRRPTKLILLFLVAGFASAEPADLSKAVEWTLARDPALRQAQAQMDQAQAGLSEARLRRLPLLSARSAFTRGDNPVYVFGSLMEQGRFGPQNFAIDALNHPGDLTNVQSALELGLPLFTGLELTSAGELAKKSVRLAEVQRQGQAQRLRGLVSQAYLQNLYDLEVLRVLDERSRSMSEELDDARKLKERGLILGSDYYAAEAIASGLQAWKIQVQADQAAVLQRLAVLTGKDKLEAQGRLSDKAYTVAAQDQLVQSGLERRPDLQGAGSQVDMAQIAGAQAGRTWWPRVNAFATLATNTNDFGSNPSNHMFGVAASLPFGDPSYWARRSQASSAAQAAQEARAGLEESIRLEIIQAYQNYQGALAVLPVAQQTRERAAQSLKLFKPLYKSGRQSILEVLRAEEGLAKAEAAYWEALLRLHGSYLQLQAAGGTLDERAVTDVATRLQG